jgi:NhaP-type Na+/H+ or K+/H+ antiporter
MTVMITILLLVIILGATIKHYNIQWLHQSGAALLLGVMVGFVVSYVRRDPMYHDNTQQSQRMTSFVEWIMFDTEFFFLVLLPPVIFESGYTLNPETLFKNFDAISVFAFLGTFTSTLVVGFIMYLMGSYGFSFPFTLREAMLFASLISSTDPVTTLSIFADMGLDPDLHAVVLGESLLNDAISIVLFEALFAFDKRGYAKNGITSAMDGRHQSAAGAMALSALGDISSTLGDVTSTDRATVAAEVAFSELAVTTLVAFLGVFMASLLIGGMVGACSAMLHKHISITGDWDEGWVVDSALVLLFPYLAYTIAESANLSGIVAVLFCGMVMGRYTRQNLDKAPRMVTMCFFKLVSFLSETFVFIYMGSSMCTISLTHVVTAVVALLAVFLGRAANVFPGAYLLNSTIRPTEELGRLDGNVQLTLWYCGLRGAVAYALAMKAAATMGPAGEAMLSCTLFVVMFTVLLMGGSTSWALKQLGIIDEVPRWVKDPDADPDQSPTKKPAHGSPGRGTRSPAGGEKTPRTARATSTYRALRQFDFKYLQPLLLAVPMKRLPRDDANAGGAAAGGDHEARGAGGVSRRTVGRGHPGAVDEERVPILGASGGSAGGDNGAGGSRAPPESPLWGSGEV